MAKKVRPKRRGFNPRELLIQLRKSAVQQGLHSRKVTPKDRMGYQEPVNSPIDQLQDKAFSVDPISTDESAVEQGLKSSSATPTPPAPPDYDPGQADQRMITHIEKGLEIPQPPL